MKPISEKSSVFLCIHKSSSSILVVVTVSTGSVIVAKSDLSEVKDGNVVDEPSTRIQRIISRHVEIKKIQVQTYTP